MTTFRVSTVITPARADLAWSVLRRTCVIGSVWLVLAYAAHVPGWLLVAGSGLLAVGVATFTWWRDADRPVYVLPEDHADEPEGLSL